LLSHFLIKWCNKTIFLFFWEQSWDHTDGQNVVDQTDNDLIAKTVIPDLVKEYFSDVNEYVGKDPCIFGDFAMADPTNDEAEDPRLYEDLGEMKQIKDKLDKMLDDYGFDHKPMSLVLFDDALLHVTKIHRIIKFPKGCGLLVGFGGSGK